MSIPNISHIKEYITKDDARYLYNYLSTNANWTRFLHSPNSRVVAKYHCVNTPLCLTAIMTQIESDFCITLEKDMFLNYYQDGSDYCPYHADVYNCDTITLSLGATRDFLVKENGKGTKASKYTLTTGDLYYMPHSIHKTYKHSIPVRKGVSEGRISILFFVCN